MSRNAFLICWVITAPWSGLAILVSLTFAGFSPAAHAVVWVMGTFSGRLGNLYFLISAVILGYMINGFLRDTARWWRWYREWRNMLRG